MTLQVETAGVHHDGTEEAATKRTPTSTSQCPTTSNHITILTTHGTKLTRLVVNSSYRLYPVFTLQYLTGKVDHNIAPGCGFAL